MSKSFDMTLFLSGVLTGSKATQQRHPRQARIMQAAIQQRWQRDKMQADPDYRENQLRSQRAWLERHPEYWR